MKDTATPTKTNLSALVAAAKRDTPKTISVAPKAPKKASKGTVRRPINKPVCKRASMAPNAPPAEIPKRCT